MIRHDNIPIDRQHRKPHRQKTDLFIHRPALLGLSEGPADIAELVIAKNRSGEMGIINLNFNGDLVKFTESSESLADYAGKAVDDVHPVQRASSWDQVNMAEGSYDPFAAFENAKTL